MRRWTTDNAELREYPPGYRTVQLDTGMNYTVYLPYMIFILRKHPPEVKTDPPTMVHRTLHCGFRVKPLPARNIMDKVLRYPPLPNIYCRSLVVCCAPNIDAFWQQSGNAVKWPSVHLLAGTSLDSYKRWSELEPAVAMRIFERWPKKIDYPHNPATGLWGEGGEGEGGGERFEIENTLPLQYTIRECLEDPLNYDIFEHISWQQVAYNKYLHRIRP